MGKRHEGCGGEFIPSYIHGDMRCSRCWAPSTPGEVRRHTRKGRPRKSRRPVALAGLLVAVAFLGVVWYFELDPADIGHITRDVIGDLADHGSEALGGISDMVDDWSVTLDNIGDTMQEAADSTGESGADITHDIPAAGGGDTAGYTSSPPDRAEEFVVEQPADGQAAEAPESPLDRTIFPNGSTYGSQRTAKPEPTKAEIVEGFVYTMTNRHRVAAGLQPLERVPAIDEIARAHSQDMAERGYFSHDTPEGLDPTDRADRAGYDCITIHGSYYTHGLAENIFWHGGWWYGAELLAGEIMDGWMDSPGHRQNIMESSYERIGVGVAINTGAVYATQNFC